MGPDEQILTANDVETALNLVKQEKPDVVFSDIDMPEMNGLTFSQKVSAISPRTSMIFVTGYAHYSLDAWKTAAKAFILKPASEDDIRNALKKIQELRSEGGDGTNIIPKRIKAVAFGNFEIYFDGKPVHFARKKSKEMVAYLIDRRGSSISADEIRSVLWEEDDDSEEKKSYIRVLANDIRKTFEELGEDSLLINNQYSYQLDISKVSCDYLDYLEQSDGAPKFNGEYMSQYSWGEMTLGNLLDM